ncbi:MAG: Protein MxiA [Phycisphaerales bacterium]|nr:Protein MxiA [Phycisphaerales bacterium]
MAAPAAGAQPGAGGPSPLTLLFEAINSLLGSFSHVGLAIGVAAILTTLIIRIEPWMMDILLAVNITASGAVMLVALYVTDSARLTAFPAVLLIMTLFRLALNVSSTRLILLEANAGEIIFAFGNIAVGGNLVVGAVVFILLVVIQLLVIAKGAERVAEVGARFTLDAMPGKQMSIDADLRSGLLTAEDARTRRLELERESKLYGAMDGAMKFVKGDAIAGIIISLVNVAAGIIVGVTQMGMTARESAETFTLLTIGDGLVTQIPALLVTFASGLAVTRVASSSGDPGAAPTPVARDMLDQLMAHPWAVAGAAALALALGFVNGFPSIIFFTIAIVVGGLSLVAFQHTAFVGTLADQQLTKKSAFALTDEMVLPVVIRLHPDMAPIVCDPDAAGEPAIPKPAIVRSLEETRARLSKAMGINYPPVLLDIDGGDRPTAPQNGYSLSVYETPLARGAVPENKAIVIATAAQAAAKGLDAVAYVAPWGRSEFAAIPVEQLELALQHEMRVYQADQLMLLHAQIALRRHAADVFGVQEAEELIDRMRRDRPRLVEAVYQRMFTSVEITEVLQRLLREEVPIRDLRLIFESLSRWKNIKQKDIPLAVEWVRKDLRGVISRRFAAAGVVIEYYALDHDLRRQFTEWVRSTPPEQPIALTMEQRRGLYDAVAASIDPGRHWTYDPVIVVPPILRRPLRQTLADAFPEVAVLATDEIAGSFYQRSIGLIRSGTPA